VSVAGGGAHHSWGCRRASSTRRRLQDDEQIMSVQRSDTVRKPDRRVWPGAAYEPNGVLVLDWKGPEGTGRQAVPNTFRVSAMLNWQIGGLTIRNHTYDCTVEDIIPPSITVQHALPSGYSERCCHRQAP